MINRSGIERLIGAGKVVQDLVTDLATSGVGVAVCKGAPKPDISTPEGVQAGDA